MKICRCGAWMLNDGKGCPKGYAPDNLKPLVDRETLELLKIQRLKPLADRETLEPVGLVPKAHYQLRAIPGKFSGQIWWAIVASPDQLKSATRHPDSGKAIREKQRETVYLPLLDTPVQPWVQQYGRPAPVVRDDIP